MRGRGRLWDLTRHCKHHCNRMLGSRNHVAERRVHHDDTGLGCSIFVDVVSANTSTANNLQVGCRRNDFCGRLGRRPDSQAVILRDRGQERVFVFAQCRHKVDINAAVFKDLHCCLRKAVGNKNFRGRHGTLLLKNLGVSRMRFNAS